MGRNKILIINSLFRSGSTLMQKIINAHEDCRVLYQPFFPFFKHWKRKFFKEVFDVDISKRAMGCDILFRRNEMKLIEDFLNIKFNSHDIEIIKKEINRNLEERERDNSIDLNIIGDQEVTAKDLFMNLVGAIGNDENIKGFKELWIYEMSHALGVIEGVKMINIVRDPRAIYVSRNYGKYLKNAGYRKYPILFIAQAWRNAVHIFIDQENMKNTLLIKYEDLVQNAKVEVKRICDFLEINFDRNMIEGTHLQKDNSSFGQIQGISQQSIDRYKEVASPWEIGVLEYLCKNEMKKMGYDIMHEDFGHRDFFKYKEEIDFYHQEHLNDFELNSKNKLEEYNKKIRVV